MEGNSIILVKGISGSGKSTRIYLFLDFLKSIGSDIVPFHSKMVNGMNKEVGVYSPDFNLVFIGKYYQQAGVQRWQGYDSMTKKFCHSEGLSFFLKKMGEECRSVLVDGAGTTATWRLRPSYLFNESGFNNILHIRYDYRDNQFEEYCERITYRSGEPPKGDSMWRKHNTFQHDMDKAVKEAEEVRKSGGVVQLLDNPYDAPVWDLGVNVLNFYGVDDVCEEFIEYCKNSDYVKQNSFENFQANEAKQK